MSTKDRSKELLRAEFTSHIKEAVELKDWRGLEHWAKQWIQMDPQNASAFKWLGRACLVLNQIPKAAYAFGRLLDFDPQNAEALKFFRDFPSSLDQQPQSVQNKVGPVSKISSQEKLGRPGANPQTENILSPEERKWVAEQEFLLAETYKKVKLFSQAAAHFIKSHEWQLTQMAALGAAQCLHKSHRGLEAVKFLRDQLFHFPDWKEGRLLLGKTLLEIGHRADAQREWQSVLDQDPNNKEALQFLSRLFSLSI